MNDEDSDGVGCFIVAIGLAIFIGCCVWGYNHPTPEESIQRQQLEQRANEDRELAEWQRIQQLREMRADKAKAEEPK